MRALPVRLKIPQGPITRSRRLTASSFLRQRAVHVLPHLLPSTTPLLCSTRSALLRDGGHARRHVELVYNDLQRALAHCRGCCGALRSATARIPDPPVSGCSDNSRAILATPRCHHLRFVQYHPGNPTGQTGQTIYSSPSKPAASFASSGVLYSCSLGGRPDTIALDAKVNAVPSPLAPGLSRSIHAGERHSGLYHQGLCPCVVFRHFCFPRVPRYRNRSNA